jgi:hypothetical protein
MFLSDGDGPMTTLEAALLAVVEAEPPEHKLRAARNAVRNGAELAPGVLDHDVTLAVAQGVLNATEAQVVKRARALRRRAIMVDDFPKDLGRTEIFQSTQAVKIEAPG